MKKSDSNDISDILPGLIHQKGWKVQLEQYDIFRKWNELAGEEVAGCSKPLKIDKNILWVEVENSAWLQQLQYQKHWLLEELNAFLTLSRLSDIRLVLDTGKKGKEKKSDVKIKFVPPPAEEFESFKSKTAWIEDEQSREALRNFWYLYHACKRDDSDK